MNTLLTRRLLQLLPMLFFISLVAFLLVKLAPGDPVAAYITPRMAPEDIERIRQSLGLDKPLVTQYVLWLKNVLQGDLGYSLIYHRPVLEMIGERIPATLGLMGASLLLAIVLAIPLGLLAGAFKHRWLDHLLNLFAYIGISVPIFWFGILLITVFAVQLSWFPSMGMRTIGMQDNALDVLRHGVLPCIALTFYNLSSYVRYIRSNTISQLSADYVQTQLAYGATRSSILFRHVLKNVLLPVITVVRRADCGGLCDGKRLLLAGYGAARDPVDRLAGLPADYGDHHALVDDADRRKPDRRRALSLRRSPHSYAEVTRMSRRWQQVRHQLRRNRPAQFSLFVLFIFVVAALFAGLSPYDPDRMALGARTLPPDAAHWFGTDEYGRDYFTRALYGGQISLMVGFLAMLFSTLIGTVVGTVSGYFGGWLDNLMMRAVDILMAIPAFFLLLVVNAYLKPGMDNIILIISLLTWMNMSRLVRAETLSVKEREYVLYARSSGEHPLRIIVRHIIPGVLPTIIVAATLNIASAILMESTLSFLGLGVQAPAASWGSMLNNAQSYIGEASWLAMFPGILILLTVFSFNVLGDVFRTAFEPGANRDE